MEQDSSSQFHLTSHPDRQQVSSNSPPSAQYSSNTAARMSVKELSQIFEQFSCNTSTTTSLNLEKDVTNDGSDENDLKAGVINPTNKNIHYAVDTSNQVPEARKPAATSSNQKNDGAGDGLATDNAIQRNMHSDTNSTEENSVGVASPNSSSGRNPLEQSIILRSPIPGIKSTRVTMRSSKWSTCNDDPSETGSSPISSIKTSSNLCQTATKTIWNCVKSSSPTTGDEISLKSSNLSSPKSDETRSLSEKSVDNSQRKASLARSEDSHKLRSKLSSPPAAKKDAKMIRESYSSYWIQNVRPTSDSYSGSNLKSTPGPTQPNSDRERIQGNVPAMVRNSARRYFGNGWPSNNWQRPKYDIKRRNYSSESYQAKYGPTTPFRHPQTSSPSSSFREENNNLYYHSGNKYKTPKPNYKYPPSGHVFKNPPEFRYLGPKDNSAHLEWRRPQYSDDCRITGRCSPIEEMPIKEQNRNYYRFPLGNFGNQSEENHMRSYAEKLSPGRVIPVQPSSGDQVRPMIHVDSSGTISVLLRKNIVVDIALDRTVRLLHVGKQAATIDDRGITACIMHPKGRVYQTGTKAYAHFGDSKLAIIGNDGIQFMMQGSPFYYTVSSENGQSGTRAQPASSFQFPYLCTDYTLNLFQAHAAAVTDVAAAMNFGAEIIKYAAYETSEDRTSVTIYGMTVVQGPNGDVEVSAPFRTLRCSPGARSLNVKTHFAEIAIRDDEQGFVKRGVKRVHVSRSGMVVSDGQCSCSIDFDGVIVSSR